MFSSLRCFLLCAFLCLPFCEAIDEEECINLGGKVCEEIEGGCFFALKPPADYKTAVEDCQNTHGSKILDHDSYTKEVLMSCLNEVSLTDRDTNEVWDDNSSPGCDSVTYIRGLSDDIFHISFNSNKDCSAKLPYFCFKI